MNGTNILFLNAGDTYTGTTWFNLFKANITADFLNILKPDAIVRKILLHSWLCETLIITLTFISSL